MRGNCHCPTKLCAWSPNTSVQEEGCVVDINDMYAIKSNDNHETCHHDFNFQFGYVNQVSHDSYFVEFAPTTIHENNFAYVESNKISMLLDHEKNALCDSYIVEFFHDALLVFQFFTFM